MKTQIPSLSSLLLVSALSPLTVHAAEKHVHGMADLFVAIEGSQVLIELESPADNIVGFEHQPRTDAQKTLAKNGTKILQDVTNIITLGEGGCKQTDAFVESPFTTAKTEEHHDHKEHEHEEEHHDHDDEHAHEKDHHDHDEEHAHEKGHDKETHSEFHATYTLECKDTKSIKTADITAFSSFKNFQEIVVNWVTSKGQGSQKVTPKSRQVKFK